MRRRDFWFEAQVVDVNARERPCLVVAHGDHQEVVVRLRPPKQVLHDGRPRTAHLRMVGDVSRRLVQRIYLLPKRVRRHQVVSENSAYESVIGEHTYLRLAS